MEPVRIEAGATVRGGRIGPGVTIEQGATVQDSEVSQSVVGAGAQLSRVSLHDSIVGADAVVTGVTGTMSVADHSVVEGNQG